MRRIQFIFAVAICGLTIIAIQLFTAIVLIQNEDEKKKLISPRPVAYIQETYAKNSPSKTKCTGRDINESGDSLATRQFLLAEVMVHSQPRQFKERILCFVMTHSNAHETKMRAVMETWGGQCDGWFVASNATDSKLGAIKIQTPALYNQLWEKLNETVHYVASNYLDQYDWFYKVDDDTFVIMENLWEFLRIKKRDDHEPQIFGYLLRDQFWLDQQKYFDLSAANRAFADYFFSHVRNASSHVEYLAGGSGYIMNRSYLQKFVSALQSNLTLFGEVPEDMAHGATMLAYGTAPLNSRDSLGREYFIPEEPALWQVRHRAQIRSGQVAKRRKCCARYAVAFHHISIPLMHEIFGIVHHCPSDSVI